MSTQATTDSDAGATTNRWPSVGVVLPTHRRPELMRKALASILAQDYPGPMQVLIVFDRAEPDLSLRAGGERPVEVVANTRTPGLAGARNTGIMALQTDLIAFCDDDDLWTPGKLTAQVQRLIDDPAAEMATCAIEVEFRGGLSERLAGTDAVTINHLARSRMVMLHSSGFVLRRTALLGGLGLVAEDAPGSQNEDYDLCLRAARRHPIAHVDQPLIRVLWGSTSQFMHQYDTKISSLHWMLNRHPEIVADGPGSARIYGQIACWHAAKKERRQAMRFAGKALRRRWREPRAIIAIAAAGGVVRIETVLATLHKRGRGI
jgi:glycosyltransferase involved in cell wall biosynthesis